MSTWNDLKEKGNKEFGAKNYSNAITYYTQAIQKNSNESSLYGNRGTCFKLLEKYKQAIRDFKKCIEIKPRETKYIRKLAEVYMLIGNFGEAQMLLQKCINLEPRDSSHTSEMQRIKNKCEEYEKINSKKLESNWEDVEVLSKTMIDNCPGFTSLKLIYIEALFENVKITQVIEFIDKRVTQEEKDDNEDFNYLRGKAYYYNGDYAKAKTFINNRLEKTMDDGRYSNLIKYIDIIEKQKKKANDYFKAEKYNEAIAEYNKLTEVDSMNKPFLSLIYSNRALCYIKQKKLMEALKDTNQAIKFNPFYSKGYLRRGTVYLEMKMFDDARSDYQKVQQLEPNNKEIQSLLQQVKEAESKGRNRDYYKILGLERNANADEIKKAYRKMALKWHPDRNGESEETKKIAQKKFIDINDAYNILSDPKKKEMYDAGVDPLNPEQGSMGGPDGFQGGSYGFQGGSYGFQGDPSEMFKVFFSGNGPNGAKKTVFYTSNGGNADFGHFSKMFSSGNFGGFSDFFDKQGDDSFSDFSFFEQGGNQNNFFNNFHSQGKPKTKK